MYRFKAGKGGTITPQMCARGALRKLGHDIETAGHWIHDIQQSLLIELYGVIGERRLAQIIFNRTMKGIKKL